MEDEAITAIDVKSKLNEFGFNVVGIVSRGDEAVKKAGDLKPDLVLMDIGLKGDMDGIEAASEIKTLFDIPVVYMSAFSNKNTFERIKSSKHYGLVNKPVNSEFLLLSIEAAIYNHDLDKKLKENEEKLKEAHDNLELKVQERTKKLESAINELERSNQELEQFAYVSSHDLQEPLRTIASFTQLLKRRYEGKFDTDADEFMDYIVEASIRMKAQIEGLLEYSRVETKGEEFEPVDTNLKLNYVLQSLGASIEESQAKITYDNLPVVMGDSNQLQRVFQNLISNAIKFRKQEERLKIRISANKDIFNSEYVFSITDNGIGIEKQYQDRIFTIFQRLHTRDVYEGTGIGLSIVKRIIERHDGRFWVESEFGVGSTFYFTLPLKQLKLEDIE